MAMAEARREPDADTMTTNTIALLDQFKTFLEDFITKILSDHPPQYFGTTTLIHMKHQSQEFLELADILLSGENFGLFELERDLLQQLRPQINDHLRIIHDLELHNGISNLRPIEIPQNLQNDLRMIANKYQDIDTRLRQVRNPDQAGQAGPDIGSQGHQPPHDE